MQNLNLYLASGQRAIKIKQSAKKTIFGILALVTILGLVAPFVQTSANSNPQFNIFTPYSCSLIQGQDYYLICVKNDTKGTNYSTSVSADPNDVLTFSVYYHNGVLNTTAHNTRVSVSLPSGQSTSQTVSANLSADNTNSVNFSNVVNLSSAQSLQYVQGSVQWFPESSDPFGSPTSLPGGQSGDQLFSGGLNLGDVQGCWAHSGLVNFKMKVGQTVQPKNYNLSISKNVQNVTSGAGFAKSVNANNGDRVRFQVQVQNTGDTALSNVVVRDILPSGLDYVSGTLSISNSSAFFGSGTNIGSLAVGANTTIIFDATVNVAGNSYAQILTNTAYAKADSVPEKQDTASVTVSAVQPHTYNLSISKNVKNVTDGGSYADNVSASSNDQVRFKVDVTNTGDTALSNVVVRDILPSGLDYVSGTLSISNSSAFFGSGTNIGSLAVGANTTIIFDATVNVAGNSYAQILTNTAYAKADSVPEKQDTASVTVSAVQPHTYNLSISKNVKNVTDGGSYADNVSASSNDQVRFKVDVTNTGDTALSNVVVRDILPSGLDYVSGTLSISNSSAFFGSGTNIGSLAVGANTTIIFDATVNVAGNSYAQILTNTAYAKADSVPEKQDTASVTVSAVQPHTYNLSISKNVKNVTDGGSYADNVSASSNDQVRFKVDVTNTGDTALSNVVVRDILPSGLDYVSGTLSISNSSAFFGSGTNIGSLAVGANTTIIFDATVNVAGNSYAQILTNTAYAKADSVPEKQDTASVTVSATPVINGNLSITKSVRDETTGTGLAKSTNASYGDKVQFSMQIGNSSGTAVNNVTLRDSLPSGLSYVYGSTIVNGSYFSDGILSGINLGTFYSGQSKTVTFEATVNSGGSFYSQTLTNTAYVSGDNVPTQSDYAQVIINQIIQNGNLSITKLVRDETTGTSLSSYTNANSGDRVQFSIQVTASGNTSVSNVRLQDSLPSGLSYVYGSTIVNGSYFSDGILSGINLGTFYSGQSKTVTFEATVNANNNFYSQTLTNTAYVSADNVSPQQASAQVALSQAPPINNNSQLLKNVANLTSPNGSTISDTASVGDTLQYTLGYQNTTGNTLNNIQIVDTLPSYVNFYSAANSGSYNSLNNTVTWSIGSLSPNASVSVSFQVTVAQVPQDQTVLVNSAYLQASNIATINSNQTQTIVYVKKPIKTITGANSIFQSIIYSGFISLAFGAALYLVLKYSNGLRMLKLKYAIVRIKAKEIL